MAPEAQSLAVIGIQWVWVFAILCIPSVGFIYADYVVNRGGFCDNSVFVAHGTQWV
jgi:hypothetical protein